MGTGRKHFTNLKTNTMKTQDYINGQIDMLTDFLDCGWLDAQYFIKLLGQCEQYNIEMSDIKSSIEDMGYQLSDIDINTYIFAAMDSLFHAVMQNVEEKAKDELKPENFERFEEFLNDLKDNYSPFINCIDSWFNNCFDEMTLNGDLDQDFKELLKAFINQ